MDTWPVNDLLRNTGRSGLSSQEVTPATLNGIVKLARSWNLSLDVLWLRSRATVITPSPTCQAGLFVYVTMPLTQAIGQLCVPTT